MCAGLGTRMRPITNILPKPMIKISNKPVLQHTIENLKKFDINEVVINLHLYPEIIKNYFGYGENFGVRIKYSFEEDLMGTAGGLGKVREEFKNETFVILSGDGYFDVDLKKVIEFHKAKKALATIVLKRYDEKFKYGVVFTDENSKIQKFVEKPKFKDIYENKVNTGIYVLEPEIFQFIPENKFYDFGNDVWPKLMQENARVLGYEMQEYWCDIGDIEAYKAAQKEILDRQIKSRIFSGDEIKNNSLVAKNVKLAEDVKILNFSTIDENCEISENCILDNCIIGKNAVINANSTLVNCIILDNCIVPENSKIYNGILLN